MYPARVAFCSLALLELRRSRYAWQSPFKIDSAHAPPPTKSASILHTPLSPNLTQEVPRTPHSRPDYPRPPAQPVPSLPAHNKPYFPPAQPA